MPTNLPPQYFDIEKKLKSTRENAEKIAVMEELLAIIPKHKGTEKLRALYKTKIAKLRSQKQKKSPASGTGRDFHIEKSGAGQMILIGPPNSGKSSLTAALTNANPEIGDYPFTTHAAAPAMMRYQNVQVQIIDTPPITPDYLEFHQAELIKSADGVLLMLDLGNRDTALEYLGILEKLREKRIELIPPESEYGDLQNPNRKKARLLANKRDLPEAGRNLAELKDILDPGWDPWPVSTLEEGGLDGIPGMIWEMLEVLRVYSKIPGRRADRTTPFIFPKGSTLMDMARTVHRDFARNLKYARIWSEGKYEGQKVQRNYSLVDGDIIELHL